MKKEKIIISLIAIMMIIFATQNIISLATEGNGNRVTITAQTGNNTNTQEKNETVNDAVGAVNRAANNATSKNESNTANNVVNNTTNKVDNKVNTESKTKLPKAGTDSTVVFLVLGFIASAIYAYKKVSDYNV